MAQQALIEPRDTSAHTVERAAKKASKGTRLARWLFVGIIISNVILGAGLWALNTLSSAKVAASDLQRRITLTEGAIGLDVVLDQNKRVALKANFDAMHSDVLTLEGVIPFGGRVGPTSSVIRALQLVDDVVSVGQDAVVMADILGPGFRTFVGSISHPVAADAQPPANAMTEDDITQAVFELKQAQAIWQAAMEVRKSLNASDLKLLPIKNVDKYLQKLDKADPVVEHAFSVGLTLVPQLHALLGVGATERLLLFDMDSDELRPTGGFLGNYGLISIRHGALTSRITLHDVYTLDCPNNKCPARSLPSNFSWFLAGAGNFGMRDSNLDPDLPRSAQLIERMYQLDGGPVVEGVVLITPALVAHLLNVTGPLYISQFHETITSLNLRDKLHYYHQNPQIAEQLGISATALGTTKFKVFDVLLSRALIAKFSSLTQAELGKLLSVFNESLQTKDLQVYSDDPQVEDILQQFGLAGAVKTAPDSLFVVDTNDQGSYANADVREGWVDHVALDAKLGAQHSLTITYDYPRPSHSYRVNPDYTDFVRVILPANAVHGTIFGDCTPVSVQESGHVVLGCRMILPEGQRIQLRFTWYTPAPTPQSGTSAAAPSPTLPAYTLLIQRQAGAVFSMQTIVSAPAGKTVVRASVDELVRASAASVVKGQAQWTASSFTTDAQLDIGLSGG